MRRQKGETNHYPVREALPHREREVDLVRVVVQREHGGRGGV